MNNKIMGENKKTICARKKLQQQISCPASINGKIGEEKHTKGA